MAPYQETISFSNLNEIWAYIQTHSFSAVCIALGLFLSPFLVKALLQVIWRSVFLLGQFFFKDQIRSFLRRKIASLLQEYVHESLDIGDTPFYQSNMITLYSLYWKGSSVQASINRAEVRVDMGATSRQYLKLWLRSFYRRFDYRLAQKELLCNCIKDVRLYQVNVKVILPEPGPEAEPQLLLEGSEQLDRAAYSLEDLRKLKLNLVIDGGEILVQAGREEFRLQNCFGTLENQPGPENTVSSLRLGCIYDGENITFNSLDQNLEHFLLVVSDLYLSRKLWRGICSCCPGVADRVDLQDGKILNLRLRIGLQAGKFVWEGFSGKLDEVILSYKDHLVEDLEVSLFSSDMHNYELKKLEMTFDDWEVGAHCCFAYEGGLLSSKRVDFRISGYLPGVISDAWIDLGTGKYDYQLQPKVVKDVQEVLAGWGLKLRKSMGSVDWRNVFS